MFLQYIYDEKKFANAIISTTSIMRHNTPLTQACLRKPLLCLGDETS
jgi:hypothetical protein